MLVFASTFLVALVASATAAPRMDNVCRAVDRRGNVSYGDCAPPTTFKTPEPPRPVIEETPIAPAPHRTPAPQPVAAVTPTQADKPAGQTLDRPAGRTLSVVWNVSGSTSRRTYPMAGVPLLAAGLLVAVVSSISFLVGAFRVGVWWGLGCLFVAPVSLVFIVMHWKVAKRPFLVNLAGIACAVAGCYVLGIGA